MKQPTFNSADLPETEQELRSSVLKAVELFYEHKFRSTEFLPGKTYIPVSGKVFDAAELLHLVDASLDFWLTAGSYAQKFEQRFADWMGVKHCLLVNSGSSANLLALSTLTSPKLGERRLQPGDEVITVAAGFPTTVNPIFQNHLVPVFVDVKFPSCEIEVDQLEAALSDRTRAIIVAHTLGNPFDLESVVSFAQRHNLWLIEDNCDAVGSLYDDRKTGTFGHLSTVSFYPAHHITMGEGGAVLTQDSTLKRIAESFRDWGRDCWCPPGVDNSCGKRFGWQLGDLPHGYDHKYTYTHVGYNLKVTDMQAAVGVAQLDKVDYFIEQRRRNFSLLLSQLEAFQDYLYLPSPTPKSNPSWFGFPLAVRETAPFTRNQLVKYLEQRRIGTRLLFGGNLTRQPLYKGLNYRTVGDLSQTDRVMNQTFWIGVFPGITEAMIIYIGKVFQDFVETSMNTHL